MGCKRTYPYHALKGLHGAADPGKWPYDTEAYSIIERSGVDSVKILTGADLDWTVVNAIRKIKQTMFIYARVMGSIYIGEHKTGRQFVEAEEHSIAALYAYGVRYFEIHNEPNLYSTSDPAGPKEGFGVMWGREDSIRLPGEEYADWWLDALDYISPRYPQARWGFPAMSPGNEIPNLRYSGYKLLEGARRAVLAADWQAVHSYWGFGRRELDSLNEIDQFASQTAKMVFVTEFSNPDPSVTKEAKGYQYENFYAQAKYRLPKNVIVLSSYVLSSSFGFESETWRGSLIPDIVGGYI